MSLKWLPTVFRIVVAALEFAQNVRRKRSTKELNAELRDAARRRIDELSRTGAK
jgi:hypothetical protein